MRKIEIFTFRIKKRQLRTQAHYYFDMIWKSGLMTRDESYQWLAKKLILNYNECHFSKMKRDRLVASIQYSCDFLNEFNRLHDYPYFKYF